MNDARDILDIPWNVVVVASSCVEGGPFGAEVLQELEVGLVVLLAD